MKSSSMPFSVSLRLLLLVSLVSLLMTLKLSLRRFHAYSKVVVTGLIFSLLGLPLLVLLRCPPAVGLLVLVVGPEGILYLVVHLLLLR